jgi:hypothetical protein
MRTRQNRYEIWASTPTDANIVGDVSTLLGALVRYVRARGARRDRTFNLLVDDPRVNCESRRACKC